jgi:sugar transferase (PEP-CTERM/EpsH1 system associated)
MRNYQFLRQLSQRHRVSLLAFGPPDAHEERAALEQICQEVYTVEGGALRGLPKRRKQLASLFTGSSYLRKLFESPAAQRTLDAVTGAEQFDIIQVESSLMMNFRFRSSAALVIDEHNIEYQLLQRMYQVERSPIRKIYNLAEYLKFRREERGAWERSDGCIVTSARDEAILQQHVPGKPTAVVENGVDLEYFQPRGGSVDPASVVFTGRLDYQPNVDAVLYFVREILPKILRRRPEVVFTVVGTGPTRDIKRLAGRQVVVTGRVPDVRPYLDRAAVAVAPVRMGAGTRLKVLEALAMGKALVSTSLGCEGLMVHQGREVLLADSADAFAGEVLRLLEDPSLGRELGDRGRGQVEAHYGWAAIVSRLEAFHASVRRPPPYPPPEGKGKFTTWSPAEPQRRFASAEADAPPRARPARIP